MDIWTEFRVYRWFQCEMKRNTVGESSSDRQEATLFYSTNHKLHAV